MAADRPAADATSATEHAAGVDASHPAPLHIETTPLDDVTAGVVASLTAAQRAQLAAYRDLLLDWSQRFNLTAITDPDEIERRLFLDALRMLPVIDDFLGEAAAARLVDIGAGAGFPGLVVAISRPPIDVTAIEATGKKVTFLQAVIDATGLSNVHAIHARAEEIAQDTAHRARYDLATARAVAALPSLMELAMPFLRVGGRAFFPKSAELGGELAQGKRAAAIVGARIGGGALLAHMEGERVTRLVIADKIADTPTRFPRRAGIPAREPLGRGSP
ncbi:MAG: 16S rRNA (guanine(527)-N(7))-methyltransferase RsmG [Thermomicrobiales bacterium]